MRTTLPVPAQAAPDAARGTAESPVAEIVTFRLVEGAEPTAFTAAADGLTPFLQGTNAVLSRVLSVDDSGRWTDHITWATLAAAQDAAAVLASQPEAAPFLRMIDPETVELRHATIRFSSQKE